MLHTSCADLSIAYEGDDYPTQLPLYVPPAALTIENAEQHFGIADYNAWADWRSTDYFPWSGFVKLGPNGTTTHVYIFLSKASLTLRP